MQWWVLSEASSTNPNGSFVVIHGTALQVKAKYNGAVSGPYATRAAAEAAAHTTGGGFPGANIPGNPAKALGISNPLAGVAAIGDFFNRLTQPNTWLRVGEFVAGGLLIYLGLSAAMRGTEAQTAAQGITKPAKKAAKTGTSLIPGVKEAKIARSAEKRVARERKVTEHAKKIRAADRAKKAS